MSRLPREARDGLMRVWLEILKERHPEVTWVTVDDGSVEDAAAVGSAVVADPVAA
jgi:hypothetical protein